MIKKITTEQLVIEMYVHDLDTGWLGHPFARNHFKIQDQHTIKRIKTTGIKNLYIDTSKGIDVPDAPTVDEVKQNIHGQMHHSVAGHSPHSRRTSVAEETITAHKIYKEAQNVVHKLMNEARLGKQVQVEKAEPLADKMIDSVFRNKDALINVARIKTKDEYTFMHCVSVCALMIGFSRTLEFERDTMREIAVGALLHDIGKTFIPDTILNKPGKLSEEEFELMKSHVVHSKNVLEKYPSIRQTSLNIASQHHERIDGTGYPQGLKEAQLPQESRMAAIADVYDALTSVRVYKDAWEPTYALSKLLEWSPQHFGLELTQIFIRTLGIYPVGSLVELDSGKVGIVIEQGETDFLKPVVRIIYDAKRNHYIPVKELDLAKDTLEHIHAAVSPHKYGIDPSMFV